MRFTRQLDLHGIAFAFALLGGCSSTDAPATNNGAAGAGAAAGAVGFAGAAAQASAGAAADSSAGNAGAPLAAGGMAGVAGGATDGGTAGGLAGGTAGAAAGGLSGSGGASGGAAGAAGSPGSAGASGFNPCPAKGTPCAIMPLGDSITFGFGSTDDMGGYNGGGYRVEIFTKAIAAGVSITFVGGNMSGPAMVAGQPFPKGNEGYSGYTIDQVSAKVDSAMAKFKPNIVLMMVGTNDMHGNVDVANAPTRLGKIIDQVVADAPNALLVVAAPIPANGTQNGLTQTFDAKVPGVVQTRAAAGKHVIFVDMYTPMAPWSSVRFHDSEHPNDAGYKIMGDTWWGKISGLLR